MTAPQWLEVLISYSFQVLVVVLACKLLERLLIHSSDRSALWNVCFFSVLMLGVAMITLPRLHLIQPWSQLQPHTLLTVSAVQSVIGRALLAIWCVGASVSLIQWYVRGHLLRKALSRCEQLPAAEVRRLLGAANLNADRKSLPAVLISDDAEGPFCWQLHTPTVVLPRFLLEGSHEDLRHVLLHELEHLTTNHPYQLFWQHLALVVCWFHPAVWRASSRASLLREFTCDEAATNHGADSAAYLRTLLRIAERCENKKNYSAIGFGRTPSEIVLRARRLVSLATAPSKPTPGRLRAKLSAGALLCVALAACLIAIPCDPLASTRSVWSPWPSWSATAAHCFGWNLRDYEQYDPRTQTYEIMLDTKAGRQFDASRPQIAPNN